jgi:hypothetical protein
MAINEDPHPLALRGPSEELVGDYKDVKDVDNANFGKRSIAGSEVRISPQPFFKIEPSGQE